MKYILLSSIIIFSSYAFAQEEADALAPIVVEDEEDSPSGHIINSERIEQRQSEDLEDVFRTTPDVTVGGAQSAAQKIYVRGIEDTNLNVTVDGARQGGYLFHHQGRLNVDPELLKRVEVSAGAGNALSGPGALGGAVVFETKDPSDFLAPGDQLGALTSVRYGSAADEKGIGLGLFAKPIEKIGILLYGNLSETINYRRGGGDRQQYTAARPRSALGKLTYQLSDFQKLTLSSVLVEDNARRTQRAHFGTSANNLPNNQEFSTLSYSGRYEYDPLSKMVNTRVRLYQSTTDLEINRDDGTRTDAAVESEGASAENTFDFDKVDLTILADANKDTSESSRGATSQKEAGEILGLAAQSEYSPHPRWTLGAGARFDDYVLEDVSRTKIHQSRLSPNAAVTHKFNDRFKSTLGWSQAFRGPTPMETILISNSTGALPVGDLKGTTAETAELNINYMLEGLEVELSLYDTVLRNPINASVINTNQVVRTNGSNITSRGYTLGSKYDRDLWTYRASFASNKTRYGNEPIGYTGASFNRGASFGDRVLVALERRLPSLRLLIGLESQFVFKLTDVPTGASQQPGYNTQDLSVAYSPRDNLNLGLVVNNIFDVRYVSHGTPFTGVNGVNSMFEPSHDIRVRASLIF